jgi:hypothetical protein
MAVASLLQALLNVSSLWTPSWWSSCYLCIGPVTGQKETELWGLPHWQLSLLASKWQRWLLLTSYWTELVIQPHPTQVRCVHPPIQKGKDQNISNDYKCTMFQGKKINVWQYKNVNNLPKNVLSIKS